MNEKIELITEQGACPICGSGNISYGKEFLDDDYLKFPATCDDCKTEFRESYYLDYFRKENIKSGDKFFEHD